MHRTDRLRAKSRRGQTGVVLIVALIVLVAMTLAALSLMRSVDTGNLIAGNMAFQQAAIHSGDSGIEKAIAWLEDCNKTHVSCTAADLTADMPSNGYAANGLDVGRNPAAGDSWDAYWKLTITSCSATKPNVYCLPTESGTGNKPTYIIDRMCAFPGTPTGGAACMASPVVSPSSGNQEEAGNVQLNAPSVLYYRITVRVAGPRNSVSYVQAMVSL